MNELTQIRKNLAAISRTNQNHHDDDKDFENILKVERRTRELSFAVEIRKKLSSSK